MRTMSVTKTFHIKDYRPDTGSSRPDSFLTIGDPHFKTSNVRENTEMVKQICELVERRQPDFVVCLGDVLHDHQDVHLKPHCMAIDFIEKIAEMAPIYVLIGNHDRPDNNDFLSEIHAFNGLKHRSNIEIVDTTQQYNIKGRQYTMVPYVQPGRLQEALSRTPDWKSSSAIFAHQEFKGAKMGAKFSEIGDLWDRTWPLMITGHIHEYQKLQLNLIYTGTPIQHGYGDTLDKTISIFEALGEVGSVDGLWHEIRVDLGLIKRKTVRMKFSELTDAWLPEDDCLTRLVLRGSEAELRTANWNPKILNLRKMGVKVGTKIIRGEKDATDKLIARPEKGFAESLVARITEKPRLCMAYNSVFTV